MLRFFLNAKALRRKEKTWRLCVLVPLRSQIISKKDIVLFLDFLGILFKHYLICYFIVSQECKKGKKDIFKLSQRCEKGMKGICESLTKSFKPLSHVRESFVKGLEAFI